MLLRLGPKSHMLMLQRFRWLRRRSLRRCGAQMLLFLLLLILLSVLACVRVTTAVRARVAASRRARATQRGARATQRRARATRAASRRAVTRWARVRVAAGAATALPGWWAVGRRSRLASGRAAGRHAPELHPERFLPLLWLAVALQDGLLVLGLALVVAHAPSLRRRCASPGARHEHPGPASRSMSGWFASQFAPAIGTICKWLVLSSNGVTRVIAKQPI